MKTLVKFGVLFLMILLLFAAFVLPKFVQRTEPPMPEKDLAAALAAVTLEEEPENTAEDPAPSPLREKKELAAFYKALDAEDFVASSDELVRLSSELEPEIVDQMTAEMEAAVASMGTTAEMESAVAALGTITEEAPTMPEPLAEVGATTELLTLTPAEESPAPARTFAPGEVVAFFALVQSSDFESAAAELSRLEKLADPATVASMKAALASAKEKEAALELSRKELEKSQQEMAKLQSESMTQIKESMKELAEVTKAAKQAAEEAAQLKVTLATAETAAPAMPEKEAPAAPVKLPETKSVAFGFDSTYLSEESKAMLSSAVVSALSEEATLNVQLRGHADATGASDYNGILARARCEIVKDFLLEKGIASERISIVSFGETQAAATGGSAEELRRVDVIFRAQ